MSYHFELLPFVHPHGSDEWHCGFFWCPDSASGQREYIAILSAEQGMSLSLGQDESGKDMPRIIWGFHDIRPLVKKHIKIKPGHLVLSPCEDNKIKKDDKTLFDMSDLLWNLDINCDGKIHHICKIGEEISRRIYLKCDGKPESMFPDLDEDAWAMRERMIGDACRDAMRRQVKKLKEAENAGLI